MDTLRVLIADDEPGIRAGMARALRDFSFRVPETDGETKFVVAEAENGLDALRKIEQDPPDILLLDFKMPELDGLELLEKISDKKDETLTIMVTAYASIETAVTATKRGAYDFLTKPFTPEELKLVVRKAAARVILAKEARKLAAEKRRARFEFVRVLGHEMKAPLNAVEGYLRMMSDRVLGDRLPDYDDCVERSLLRIGGMRKLVADLLDMTQIESGVKHRELVELNVVEIAKTLLDAFRGEADSRKIALALDSAEEVPMRADRGELEMLFTNLISNAIKYNRDQGKVEVRIRRKGEQVAIAVSDTGVGIADEDLPKLFQEFSLIRNERTQHILGSGLGLSIVKKLALLYAGDAQAVSMPGEGSTFTVTLSANG